MAAKKTKANITKRHRLFIVVGGFSLLFFAAGVMLALFVVRGVASSDTFLTQQLHYQQQMLNGVEKQQQRDVERQQLYVDYSQSAGTPAVADEQDKQRQLDTFDKAFKPELTTCDKQPAAQVDYAAYRKINQYANRIVARDCYGRDYMFFLNRAGEWQQSNVNIVQEFASAKTWLSACYLDDILPTRDTQPESSKYIGERNQIECEYIAKYQVPMTNDQVNKAYEEKYGGH